jgi:5'-nucleotidase
MKREVLPSRIRPALVATLLAAAIACVAGACDPPSASSAAQPAAAPVGKAHEVRILAMNDLHGHLQPPNGSNGNVYARPTDAHVRDGGAASGDNRLIAVPAGGVAYVATHLKRLKDENPANIFVHAGDLTGATPLESALFHDEPPILVMNQLGLRYNAVGNHEFDRGLTELRRFQRGGCFADKCEGDGGTFPGARFSYLAANVTQQSGGTLFPAYDIATVGSERIAFIGMTLKGTPSIVAPRNIQGLSFRSEVETVNALIPELRSKGAGAIVVLVHQGGMPSNDTPYDGCGLDRKDAKDDKDKDHKEAIVDIVKDLDPAVDVVVTAHSHRAYVCELSGKIVTSAASYGRVITTIDLTFDPATHRVVKKVAHNIPVTHDVPKDPAIDSLVQSYVSASSVRANRVVGHIASDLIARASSNGESNLGDFIADAMLAATSSPTTGSAVVAFMNPGGLRADIRTAPVGTEPPGTVTYGKIFAAQPFANVLYTVTLTGTQLEKALEEQFHEGSVHVLQPSKGLSYTYDRHGRPPSGHHIVAGTLQIDGVAVDPARTYRVTVSDFTFNGGEGFRRSARAKTSSSEPSTSMRSRSISRASALGRRPSRHRTRAG